jgi:hypothetical protein
VACDCCPTLFTLDLRSSGVPYGRLLLCGADLQEAGEGAAGKEEGDGAHHRDLQPSVRQPKARTPRCGLLSLDILLQPSAVALLKAMMVQANTRRVIVKGTSSETGYRCNSESVERHGIRLTLASDSNKMAAPSCNEFRTNHIDPERNFLFGLHLTLAASPGRGNAYRAGTCGVQVRVARRRSE